MKVSRLMPLCVLLITCSLLLAADAQALCVKCVVNECWGSGPDRNAARCYSYGTACLTSGYCDSSGEGDHDPFDLASNGCAAPLSAEYILTSVRIEQPNRPVILLATLDPSSARR